MRVLVTGATGFIGANLVRLLLERGFEVRILRRATSSNRALEGLKVERVTGELADMETMSTAVRDCRRVFHLAGAYETGPDAYERMYQCHVTGTRVLCQAALQHGVERIVICSSSVTLPFGPRSSPASEDDPDPFAATGIPYRAELRAYYEAKRSQENVARGFVAQGLDVVLVHPDFVLGPWDVKPSSGKIILQVARAPWIPFYPPGGKSFISSRDCAMGHLLAMEKGRTGVSYLLGDHNLTFQEALTTIAQVAGRPPPRWPLPTLALKAAGRAERWAGQYIPAITQTSAYLESLFLERYRSPARARRELGLGSTPFETIVEDAYRWFRDTHAL